MLTGTFISLPSGKAPGVIEEEVEKLQESEVVGTCSEKVSVGHDCTVVHKSSQ